MLAPLFLLVACSGNMQQFEGRMTRLEEGMADLERGVRSSQEERRAQDHGLKQQSAEVKMALETIDGLVARVEDITRDLEQRQQDVAAQLDDLTRRMNQLERASSPAGESSAPRIEATAREVFDRARTDFDAGHPELAAMGFQSFIEQYQESPLADDAQFMLGECYYVADRFDEALTEYERLLDTYPASDKRALAMLRGGTCLLNTGSVDRAVSMLREVMEKFPGTREAVAARERLAGIE
jgi:tol-pal system protein YbgF